MQHHVLADHTVDVLLERHPAHRRVALRRCEGRVGEQGLDVRPGRPERAERVVVEGRRRAQRATERRQHDTVHVDDVADDVAGRPLVARRRIGPTVGWHGGDLGLEGVGPPAVALGDLGHRCVASARTSSRRPKPSAIPCSIPEPSAPSRASADA